MNKDILLIGAGGHCKSIINSILSSNESAGIAVIDSDDKKSVLGFPVIGCDADLPSLFREGYTRAFVAVGSVGDAGLRRRLTQELLDIGFTLENIIDASASVSPFALLGKGVFVGAGAVIGPGAAIGDGVIVNTRAVVEHDSIVEDFVHIAPGAVLCGTCFIGENTHIGAGSVTIQGRCVGKNCLIGAGSAVVSDIEPGVVAYGNPCKAVREHK